MASQVINLNQSVTTLQGTTSKKEAVNLINYPNLAYYAESFVKNYINYSKTANENKENERLDSLSKFVYFDVSMLKEDVPNEFTRTLKSVEMVDVKEVKECLLVSLLVTIETKVKAEVQSETKQIVLPIQAKNGLYSLVSVPYFLAVDLPLGKTTALESTKNTVEIDTSDKKAIQKFLALFFEKYASGNQKELLLMMKSPVITTGQEVVKTIEPSSIKYFKTNSNTNQGLQVTVTFENKETKISHQENFTLWIRQTDNSYFIEQFKNYFTEDEG
nr:MULTISPECIES: conjugal transfer protein [unclassified Enterococcus]